MGKGLETVAKPIGGIIDPVVGGLMRSGGAFGDLLGSGHGNMDKRKVEAIHKEEEEKEERHAPVGGQEQNADNPLGL